MRDLQKIYFIVNKGKMDERIKNIKIAVHNEEESEQVQEKLVELGAFNKVTLDANYLIIHYSGNVYTTNDKKSFDKEENKEIYVEDLLNMEIQEEDKPLIHYEGYAGSMEEELLVVRSSKIKEAKEKILEDFNNNFNLDEINKTRLKQILDKQIGFDDKTRVGGKRQ